MISAWATFFIPGVYMALWAGYVPFLKARLNIGDDVLGSMILVLGIGSIISMTLAGKVANRFGCRFTVVGGNLVGMLATVGITLSDTVWMASTSLFFFGLGMGLGDVAANLQTLLVEKMSGRKLMSGFHGGWSIGGFIGALLLLFLLNTVGLSIYGSIWGTIAGLIISLFGMAPGMLSFGKDESDEKGGGSKNPLSFHPIAIIFGILAFISYLVEGGMSDWSAIFLNTEKDVPIERAVMGIMFYHIAMTIGRLAGNAVSMHVSPKRIVVTSYFLGAIALGIIIVAPHSWALASFVLLGLSLSMIVPNLFSAMGMQKVIPMTQALSTATTLGYVGVLAGPALIGYVSHSLSIIAAFTMLAGLLLISMGLSSYAYRLIK